MVALDDVPDRIARQIYSVYEQTADDWRRSHLGASIVGGTECLRQLWYSFRWAASPRFGGRILRLFERGQREEAWIIRDLRAVGIDVFDVDKDGNQLRCRIAPHFGGSCDGTAVGVPGARRAKHVLEIKTANKRRFDALTKNGVREAMPGHYGQMQVYMMGFDLQHALYVCVCKDDDRIHTERIDRNDAVIADLVATAEAVINASEPPPRISDDPAWYECKFCSYRDVCHFEKAAERSCRTCRFSAPLTQIEEWACDLHGTQLSLQDQRDGCSSHEPIDAGTTT